MGFFDRFRRDKAPAPPPPQPSTPTPTPTWEPVPPLAAAMEVAMLLVGRADDPEVLAVHGAVEAALARRFGDQLPLAWRRVPAGPLALVRAYRVDAAGGPFFHYLGWGLTEMGPKASDDPEVSGFGIELSMKVQAFDAERAPAGDRMLAQKAPLWPVELLARLATVIQRSRRPFGHDHWIEAGAKAFGPAEIRHLACAFDDAFEPIATPTGRFRFLQLYTIDDAELEQFKQADRAKTEAPVLAARRAIDPHLVVQRPRGA